MKTIARRRLSSVLIALGVMVLVIGALVGFRLWQNGYFLTGAAGRVAAILRGVKREEERSSSPNFINRLRYSLPGPLDDFIGKIFPSNSVGEYEYTQKLAALGTNAISPLLTAVEFEQSVAARRVAADALVRLNARQATPLFARVLRKDTNSEVRVAMAGALRDMRDTNAIPSMLEGMEKDAEPTVRSTCAEALGDLRVHAAAPAILTAMGKETDDSHKAKMAAALGQLTYASAAPTLIKLLTPRVQSPTPAGRNAYQSSYSENELREEVAKALGAIGGEAALDSLIGQLAQEKEESVGEAICEALGRLGGPKASVALRAQLDAQSEFRVAAATALGEMHDSASVKDLIGLFEDRAEEVRAAAITAVGVIGDASALESLRRLLPKESEDSVMQAGCTTLALIGDKSDQTLVEETIHRMGEHDADSIWAAIYLSDTNSMRLLTEILKGSKDDYSRFAAAYGLALIGGREARQTLGQNLSDKNEYAAHGKACALLMLGDDAGLKTVRASLQCDNDWQRFGAVLAVDQSGLKSASELLGLVEHGPEDGVQQFAAGAKTGQASTALIGLLQTGDNSFRNYAARALLFYHDTNAVPALTTACDDEDEEVRESARLTLRRLEREQKARSSP